MSISAYAVYRARLEKRAHVERSPYEIYCAMMDKRAMGPIAAGAAAAGRAASYGGRAVESVVNSITKRIRPGINPGAATLPVHGAPSGIPRSNVPQLPVQPAAAGQTAVNRATGQPLLSARGTPGVNTGGYHQNAGGQIMVPGNQTQQIIRPGNTNPGATIQHGPQRNPGATIQSARAPVSGRPAFRTLDTNKLPRVPREQAVRPSGPSVLPRFNAGPTTPVSKAPGSGHFVAQPRDAGGTATRMAGKAPGSQQDVGHLYDLISKADVNQLAQLKAHHPDRMIASMAAHRHAKLTSTGGAVAAPPATPIGPIAPTGKFGGAPAPGGKSLPIQPPVASAPPITPPGTHPTPQPGSPPPTASGHTANGAASGGGSTTVQAPHPFSDFKLKDPSTWTPEHAQHLMNLGKQFHSNFIQPAIAAKSKAISSGIGTAATIGGGALVASSLINAGGNLGNSAMQSQGY